MGTCLPQLGGEVHKVTSALRQGSSGATLEVPAADTHANYKCGRGPSCWGRLPGVGGILCSGSCRLSRRLSAATIGSCPGCCDCCSVQLLGDLGLHSAHSRPQCSEKTGRKLCSDAERVCTLSARWGQGQESQRGPGDLEALSKNHFILQPCSFLSGNDTVFFHHWVFLLATLHIELVCSPRALEPICVAHPPRAGVGGVRAWTARVSRRNSPTPEDISGRGRGGCWESSAQSKPSLTEPSVCFP